ncbi:MAG: H-NS histone family protein [Limnobacter sp.]|nr:H-NS histone family protein [Limnobacter sp.]
MKKINLNAYSTKELSQLQDQVQAELKNRAERDKAIEEVKKLAVAKGIGLDELVSVIGGGTKAKAGKSRGIVPVKYRHPKDPSKTWTGRGKTPLWFKDALASGLTEKQLTVK